MGPPPADSHQPLALIIVWQMLDHYTISTALLIILIAIEARVMTFFIDPALSDSPPPSYLWAQTFDRGFVVAINVTWLYIHLHFGSLSRTRMFHPRLYDPNLQDKKNQLLDKAIVPDLRVEGSVSTRNMRRASLVPVKNESGVDEWVVAAETQPQAAAPAALL